MGENREQGGGRRRRRNGGSDSQAAKGGIRRAFLKWGIPAILGTTAAVASFPKVVDFLQDRDIENQLHDFRKNLPTLPDNLLTEENEGLFKQEGWSGKFERPFIDPSLDNEAAGQLIGRTAGEAIFLVEENMRRSVFKPFSDTVSYLDGFFNKDVPGKLTKGLAFLPTDQFGGNTAYYTQIKLDDAGNLETSITGNAWLFSPEAQGVEDTLLTRATWAIGLDHEKYHHFLAMELFGFWKGLGLSPQEAFQKTLDDEGQEPYAYWQQAAATHQILSTGMAEYLPFAMVDTAHKWRKLSAQGVHWYDTEWSDFLNENTVLPVSVNMPFKQANEVRNEKLLASKPISDFI